jgi:hypothetical protein
MSDHDDAPDGVLPQDAAFLMKPFSPNASPGWTAVLLLD